MSHTGPRAEDGRPAHAGRNDPRIPDGPPRASDGPPRTSDGHGAPDRGNLAEDLPEGTVRFTPTDAARLDATAHAVLRTIRLPMAWWRGVTVRRRVEHTLSNLERFVLEAAVSLGGVDGAELTAISGLPGQVLPVLCHRLVAAGVLVAVEGGYAPQPQLARSVLSTGHLHTDETTTTDLVFLPETDEVIAVDPRTSGDPLAKLDNRRLDPSFQVPADERLARTPTSEFFRRRIQDGHVAGLSDRVHDVVPPAPDPPLLPGGFCPVYECDAIVRPANGGVVPVLTIRGRTLRRRRDQDENSGQRQVSLRLPGATRLADQWIRATNLLADPRLRAAAWAVVAAGEQAGAAPRTPQATRATPMTWQYHLDGGTAAWLAEAGQDLSAPVGLQARTPRLTVCLRVEFAATDESAAARITVDREIRAADQADDPAAALHATLAELARSLPASIGAQLGPDAVLARAWQLGRYPLAYALRRERDFDYA